jgi:hypothetical protein
MACWDLDRRRRRAWFAQAHAADGRRFPSYEHAEHETRNWIGFSNGESLHE